MPFPPARPHVLGIDDGPFEKFVAGAEAPLVGVMMEGADVIEAVAVTRFPVDGDGITDFLADWIESLRFRAALHAVIFGGVTLAGLALLDPEALARRLRMPVLVINRKAPSDAGLREALSAAGLAARIPQLERMPPAFAVGELHASVSGVDREQAAQLLACVHGRSVLPEPLRVAHLVARAIATGQSRGRP